jgi:hypothetical protein
MTGDDFGNGSQLCLAKTRSLTPRTTLVAVTRHGHSAQFLDFRFRVLRKLTANPGLCQRAAK